MYKVIEGHKYSTETAKELARWQADCSTSDFAYCEETLFKTKTGLYFLYGQGGGWSRYSKQYPDGSIGWGELIEPMSEDAAREWAEKKCSGETYERIFGDPEANAQIRRININLDIRTADKLDAIKSRAGKSYKDLITAWIWEHDAEG